MRSHKILPFLAAAILFLMPAVLNGNRSSESPTPEVTPEVTQLAPGTPCPASPAIQQVPAQGMLVSGEDPIWAGNFSHPLKWSELGKTLPPYSGALMKIPLFVQKQEFADIELQVTQLDGDGTVLFPLNGTESVEENGMVVGSKVRVDLGEPVETFLLPKEYHRYFGYAVTGDYAQTGTLFIVPAPGCYQLTAKLREHTVSVVYDIRAD
jgi:hypothetical protein